MATDFTWPKPWLLDLYAQAVEAGCIRIKLRGESEPERDLEYKSFKAAFYRCRRRKDSNYATIMRPEYAMVSIRYEKHIGRVLILYSALPDGEQLPTVEAVDHKHNIPQPLGSQSHPTPETDPEEFDATQHVESLISKIDLSGDDVGEL